MSAAAPDWLGVARSAVRELRDTLAGAPTTAERARETGTRGEGGDHTLEIDAAADRLRQARDLLRREIENARLFGRAIDGPNIGPFSRN